MVKISSQQKFTLRLLLILLLMLLLNACAAVPQMKRQELSDPIMQLSEDPQEDAMEGHNMPRREGSIGGGAGAGGGCGC